MTNVDPLLKAREVAAMLSISIASLYRRIGDGTLPPPIKLGHLARWSRADIVAAIAQAKGQEAADGRGR